LFLISDQVEPVAVRIRTIIRGLSGRVWEIWIVEIKEKNSKRGIRAGVSAESRVGNASWSTVTAKARCPSRVAARPRDLHGHACAIVEARLANGLRDEDAVNDEIAMNGEVAMECQSCAGDV
jgi:hypothetical protein